MLGEAASLAPLLPRVIRRALTTAELGEPAPGADVKGSPHDTPPTLNLTDFGPGPNGVPFMWSPATFTSELSIPSLPSLALVWLNPGFQKAATAGLSSAEAVTYQR